MLEGILKHSFLLYCCKEIWSLCHITKEEPLVMECWVVLFDTVKELGKSH